LNGSDNVFSNAPSRLQALQVAKSKRLGTSPIKVDIAIHVSRISADYNFNRAALINNAPLANEYALYMEKYQNELVPWIDVPTASTDFGNVSHKIPCIHPTYKVRQSHLCARSKAALLMSILQQIPTEKESQNHTHGFTKSAGTKEAHEATEKAMKGLAAVGCRILTDSVFLDAVKQSFRQGEGNTLGK